MAQVAELTAKVKMDGTKEAAKQVEGLTKDFGFLGNAVVGAIKVLDWGANTLLKGANMATEYARQIDVMTYKSQINAETYQKLDQAFKQHKGNIQDYLSVYENLQMRMANWKYQGRNALEGQAYELLGINPDAYDDAMKLMSDVTKALNAQEDAGERARLAGILGFNMELLRVASKSDYKIFDNILQTQEETAALTEQEQAVNALSMAWDGLIRKIGGKFRANYGTPVVKWATQVTQDMLNAANAGSGFFSSLGNAASVAGNEIAKMRLKLMFPALSKYIDKSFSNSFGGSKVAYTAGDLFDLTDKQSDGKANGHYIMKRLMDAGYSREWAAAMVGGLTRESDGLKLSALGDENVGGSYGLAQWHAGRWDALKAFAQAQGKHESDLDVQIDYLLHELANDFKMTPSRANEMSFHDAAKWILEKFENPADKSEAELKYRKSLGVPYLQASIAENYSDFGANAPISESNKNIVNNFNTNMSIYADSVDGSLLQSSTGKMIEQYLNNTSMSILEGNNNG